MSRKSQNSKHRARVGLPHREYHFDAPFETTSVDAENGVIRGVSVITSGIKARGHDLHVDDKTLLQMLEAAESMGRVPVKWNHKTGADAVNGYLENFSIVGGKLKADWHLLASHSQRDHALELAQRMPTGIGLSASFTGKPEKKGEKSFARCDELVSVDLVATPAANPSGLFSQVDRVSAGMDGQVDPNVGAEEDTGEVSNAEILEALRALQQDVQGVKDWQDDLEEQLGAEDDGEFENEEEGYEEEGYDDGYGDGGEEAAYAGVEGGGEAAEAFNAIVGRLNQLEAHIETEELAAEQAQTQHAFDVVAGKIEALIELNDQLAAENEVLLQFRDQAQAALRQQNGGREVHFAEDGTFTHRGDETDFEVKVREFEAGGKSRADAVREAMKDSNLYQQHLEAKRVVNSL